MKVVGEIRVDPDHPSLSGHFPDRPLVPAVVILQRAIETLTAAFVDCRVCGVPQAKFLSPLAPGESAQLTLRRTAPGIVQFECAVGERRIATGRFQVQALGARQ